jgi:hypothetical protein
MASSVCHPEVFREEAISGSCEQDQIVMAPSVCHPEVFREEAIYGS